MSDSKYERERRYKIRNASNENAAYAVREEKRRHLVESDDTKKRKEIQTFIRDNRDKNKSKLEILSALYEKFGGIEYGDYHRYFESWVDHALRGRNDRDEGR